MGTGMSTASPDISGLGPLARVLSDARVVVAEEDPRLVSPEAELFAEEHEAVKNAVLSRRRQFAAGRRLARQAWQRLGQPPVALLNDAQRVPIWPAGVVGSITHTEVWCGVAVARAREVSALGTDVEVAAPLEVNLWDRVCRPEERAFLERLPPDAAGLVAKGIFSAKESIYKALYPSVRVFLDFQGMSIELEAGRAGSWTWHATSMVDWGSWARGHRFAAGALLIGPDVITSAVVW
jgi:4'-phosphopantetheinyl transferase EntD